MTWETTYQTWKNFENLDGQMKKELDQLESSPDQLEDAFYKALEFGTAGMRGKMGPGINRMNIYTIRQASLGLANYLLETDSQAKTSGVAISYDSRHYAKEFALEAARTLGQQGIQTYVVDELRPTPFLSFAVRHLKAAAGIMITASHNPPEYNGFKVYGSDGAQLLPDKADELTSHVQAIDKPLEIEVASVADLKASGLLKMIGHRVDKAYLDLMRSVSLNPKLIEDHSTDLKIVYTPLHGTGQKLGMKALYNAGFKDILEVPSQKDPDPNFSTVESPNPEDREAFQEAIKIGKEKDADILIASDPDADRLGVAVKTIPGSYTILTGNEIASLMTDYILGTQLKYKLLPKHPVIIKSVVSSELPARIADSYGAKVEDVLTGFKFIAERIEAHSQTTETTFMFGFEESYGFLSRPFVRDKDAIQAMVLIAEIALYYKLQNFTLVDALFNLYNYHGHFKDEVMSIKLEGKSGREKINQIMQSLRNNRPREIANHQVKVYEDFLESKRYYVDGEIETIDLPSANVLKFKMTDGSWVAIRPSGTEPKIKFYLSAVDGAKLEVDKKIDQLKEYIETYINK